MNVGTMDLGILLLYIGGVVLLGSWVGRGARTASDYMLGGRNLPWWVILASIVATETSTVTFLSIPGFAFGRDLTWLQIPLGYILGRFAVIHLLLPHFFKGEMFTAYEVLHRRFGGVAERAASLLFVLTRSLADGLRLFLSALVLQEMAGIDLPWAVLLLGVTTIAYTFYGGMRAVLWTDLVQLAVYLGGALVAFRVLLQRLPDGWGQLVSVGGAAGKLEFLELGWDLSEPYGLWAGLIGGAVLSLGTHGVDQMMVQRYLCARSLRDARRALAWSGFVVLAQFALFLLIGVGLYVFYQVYPPAAEFERTDRVFAFFIVREMPAGLVGVLLGAVFAAAMSTLSSSLNSCATAAVKDLYQPLSRKELSAQQQLRATRLLTVAFGLVQIAVAIGSQWLASTVVSSVLGIAGFTTGIILGVFFLGIFTRQVGERAALVGLVLGTAAMTWIFFATSLAWPWYALVGSVLTFFAGLGASALLERRR